MIAARRVRVSGAILLVVGILAAATIFYMAPPREEPELPGDDVSAKREVRELEKMGGKMYILFNDINQWFASLWHGRRLAYTVGVFSIAGFLSCRWFATLLEQTPVGDDLRHTDDDPA